MTYATFIHAMLSYFEMEMLHAVQNENFTIHKKGLLRIYPWDCLYITALLSYYFLDEIQWFIGISATKEIIFN